MRCVQIIVITEPQDLAEMWAKEARKSRDGQGAQGMPLGLCSDLCDFVGNCAAAMVVYNQFSV
jgi:hypothetical protein